MEDSRVEDILASGQRDYKFTNWSSTFSCSPELYFEPKTTEEIREVGLQPLFLLVEIS